MTDDLNPDDFPKGYHGGKYIRAGLREQRKTVRSIKA
jgi:hypothetical protein